MTFYYLSGAEPNAGSQASRARQHHQGLAKMDCDGAQDEGNLPRAQHVQHGRDRKVFDRRMLGAAGGLAESATRFNRWKRKFREPA